jgi:GNAT superfamily N-acetyltransferase
VLSLGGFALELSGGTLVTNERIPVPAFNYVEGVRVAPQRQSAFFETALDHFFQRALRPSFRVAPPVPVHVDRTLRGLGFVVREDPLVVLASPTGGRPTANGARVDVDPVGVDEAGTVSAFWTHARERDEFQRGLTVAMNAPNPGQGLVALLAREQGVVVGAGLIHFLDGRAEVHAVSTAPAARGHGVATDLVRRAMGVAEERDAQAIGILSTTPRLARRLAPLGFGEVERLVEYHLPPDAELAIPSPGPPTPPRWRPPRSGR